MAIQGPFVVEISEVRDAEIQCLSVICETLKCRAIILLNQTGTEPFFYTTPYTPNNYRVDYGFSVGSRLTKIEDPFIYFSKAAYIPFETTNKIALDVDISWLGIT
ncbi:predicted protein [Coccidioides posadasii str. Silveira]|uniref:Predicted protein n=2 Tax=Coccidioides posadasii TaxID=199306 RepID=E9D3B5_COCPS|nr:predicted protein [Coccidioides posadasii str. Silveira]KMM71456.1 hypothetical protein CPAG_07763 [Coccidioides posadasii RMSCC 3488]